MKKLLAVLLAVVLCVSVCSISAFAADEDKDIVVTATGGTTSRGQTITVPVKLETNSKGFITLGIEVAYDEDVLELVCSNHDANGEPCVGEFSPVANLYTGAPQINFGATSQFHTVNPYVMQWAFGFATSVINYTGVLGELTFKVKDDAAFGDTNVVVTVTQASGKSSQARTFTGGTAVVTVACVNHEAAAPVVVEPAKCDQPGSQTISCKHCGYLMATEPIPATGHEWGNWEGSAAAQCGQPGEEKRVCANDATHFETRATDALEHLWDDGVETTPAGCETPGEKTHTCQRDNTHTKKEPIDPTGHDWDDGVETTPAGCEDPGEKTYTCQNDATHTKKEPVAPTGHEWDNGVETTPAGCETPGEKTYTCQNDPTHTKTEPIDPTGHDITWTVTTPPSVDQEGERTGTCGTCGEPFTEPMPKLTNKVDGDKVSTGVMGADGKITDADIDASFETTDDEPFTGYVEGAVIKVPVSAWDDEVAVAGKDGVVGFAVNIADADDSANLDPDKVIKVTIKLDNALLAQYENLVAYTSGTNGLVALDGAEIVDGSLVITGKVSDIAGLEVAVFGDKIVTDEGKEPGKSPETGDTSAIAFVIVMMAIAAAAVVVTGKKVKA